MTCDSHQHFRDMRRTPIIDDSSGTDEGIRWPYASATTAKSAHSEDQRSQRWSEFATTCYFAVSGNEVR